MKITQQRNNDKNTTLSTMGINTFAQKVRILNRIKQYNGIPLSVRRVSLFGCAR